MDHSPDAPRQSSGLMAIISRRASNAANAIRGGEGVIDIDLVGGTTHAPHQNHSHSQSRRRGDREASNTNNSRESQAPGGAIAVAANTPVLSTSTTLSSMLRRRRSGDVGGNTTLNSGMPAPTVSSNRRTVVDQTTTTVSGTVTTSVATSNNGQTIRIRLVPHLENQRSLRFDPIARELKGGDPPLRIGRFTDRNNAGSNSNRLAFKSKVVSRGHAEIWLDAGKFYIKDTKSSSGTFLNHQRLAAPSQESKPHALKDGDILQLGVDFQGGHEDIYKCVKIRVEIGREWQKGSNAFNSQAMKTLRALTGAANDVKGKDEKRKVKNGGDCCICLFGLQICQSIFIAPCSHSFHYKCIRPLLEAHHPGFTCPLCRTFADLNEDVEVDDDLNACCEDEEIIDDVTPLLAGNKFAGNTLNGREGTLSVVAEAPDDRGFLAGPTVSTAAVVSALTSMRNNSNRNSSHSAMQVAEEEENEASDAEMYDREESIDRRIGEATDAEFSMPRAVSRSRDTAMSDFDEEEEAHFSNHERPEDAMDVEQEAEEQALRDGGRDIAEAQEPQDTGVSSGTNASSSHRSSEEIVANVIDGYQNNQSVDDSHWDRTYIPDDYTPNPALEPSPRSSQDGSIRPAISIPACLMGSQVLAPIPPPRNATIQTNVPPVISSTTAAASQSSPDLAISPQSPTARSRLIRVPSLTSPITSSRQKRRSITRFGSGNGALSENESSNTNTVLGSNFLGTLLGRKRGTSISAHPGSPTAIRADGLEEMLGSASGSGSSGGSAEGHGTVGEKRKR